jgi:hypothetical protein
MPNIICQEKIFVNVLIVNVHQAEVKVREHFLQFTSVGSTKDKASYEGVLQLLQKYDISFKYRAMAMEKM